MKSQIGDLRKHISVIKTGLAKQQTPAAVEIQEPSAPEVPVNNTSVNVETSNMFSVLSGVEDDQLTLENCSSSSLDAATTNNTDPSHDSTVDSHDSTPPRQGTSAITASPPNHTDRDARTSRERMAECSLSWQNTRVHWGLCVPTNQTRADVPSQSTPKDQRLRPQRRPTLAAECSKMQRRPAAGRPRRGEHLLGEHSHGEHVEGSAQTAQVSVPQCRRPPLLSNPATLSTP